MVKKAYTVDGDYVADVKIHRLNKLNVNLLIPKTSIAGNYWLGVLDDEGDFRVVYIGRSDDRLNERLCDHVDGIAAGNELQDYNDQQIYFSFSYAKDAKDAYYQECEDYHRFDDGESGEGCFKNKIHPDSPDNTGLECPYCD